MRSILLLFFVSVSFSLLAQNPIPTTESFTVEGKVKKTMIVTVVDLLPYKIVFIDSIVITNHLQEKKVH